MQPGSNLGSVEHEHAHTADPRSRPEHSDGNGAGRECGGERREPSPASAVGPFTRRFTPATGLQNGFASESISVKSQRRDQDGLEKESAEEAVC